jgi:hypothetical protein
MDFKLMKTLLFFHREQLANMYVGMEKELIHHFNIIHVVFSRKEEMILKAENITKHIINFEAFVNEAFDKEKLDYDFLIKIDKFFIKNTDGRFTLNGSIQSDRGLVLLSYERALLMSQIYYKFWESVFQNNKIDYAMHEPPSLLLNHICALMCKQYHALYVYPMMVPGEQNSSTYLKIIGDQCHSLELINAYDKYITYPELINFSRCQIFLSKFRGKLEIFLSAQIKKEKSYWRLRFLYVREIFSKIKNKNRFHMEKNNINYWIINRRPIKNCIKNLKNYKKYIKFENLDISRKYYYYAFHLEPEASVLYLGDGIYKSQVKLIENIAAQLPVGIYLYVKDHPHEYGYRSVEDYKRLQLIPNIKLLHQSIPGKEIIKSAIGVFTINGTTGLEALLLNKQVYIFGAAFYDICKRVNYIRNIKDLREILYKSISVKHSDDTELYAFVNAYLDSLKKGTVDYFSNRAKDYGIDLPENERHLALDFIDFSKNY